MRCSCASGAEAVKKKKEGTIDQNTGRKSKEKKKNKVTHRRVRRLMVDVDERAADVGEHLELVLQLLAQVVRFPERRVGVHDDIDLDKVVLLGERFHTGWSRESGMK